MISPAIVAKIYITAVHITGWDIKQICIRLVIQQRLFYIYLQE